MQRAFISPPPLFNLAPFQRNLWEYVRTLLILFVVVVIIIEPITLFNLLFALCFPSPLSDFFWHYGSNSLTHSFINQSIPLIYLCINPSSSLHSLRMPLPTVPFAFRSHDAPLHAPRISYRSPSPNTNTPCLRSLDVSMV